MSPKPPASVALNPADFRLPPNGDLVASTQTGREWVEGVQRALLMLVSAQNRTTVQIDQLAAAHRELSNNVMRAMSERPPRPRADSWGDVTGVENLDAAKDLARDFRERFQDERARAERAEAAHKEALALDQKQLEAAQAQVKSLLFWFRVILVTFITLALGGGAFWATRGGQPSASPPTWAPGP